MPLRDGFFGIVDIDAKRTRPLDETVKDDFQVPFNIVYHGKKTLLGIRVIEAVVIDNSVECFP